MKTLLAATIITLSIPGMASSSSLQNPVSKPSRLEGLDYKEARKIVAGYGWKPVSSGKVEALYKWDRVKFPEIADCSSVGVGYCGMTFSRGNRCLFVTTDGGPPGGAPDAIVRRIVFRPAPCQSN